MIVDFRVNDLKIVLPKVTLRLPWLRVRRSLQLLFDLAYEFVSVSKTRTTQGVGKMPEGSLHLDQLRSAGPDTINNRHPGTALFRRPEDLSELSITTLAAECVRRLAAQDIFIDQTSDFDLAMQTIEQLDKPYLTDYMSPLKNDFFESNCFWLILNDQNGQPGGQFSRIGCHVMVAGGSVWSPRATRRAFLVKSILTSKIIIRFTCLYPGGGVVPCGFMSNAI